MKKTQEINGLPVIAINSGKNAGKVESTLVNAENKQVDYLLLDREKWYREVRALKFTDIAGIGEYAVTIQDMDSAFPVTASEHALGLLSTNVNIINTNILTTKGQIIGTVSEYYIDEDYGRIAGCELVRTNEETAAGIIPAEYIVTYNEELTIVHENAEDNLLQETELKENTVPVETPKDVRGKSEIEESSLDSYGKSDEETQSETTAEEDKSDEESPAKVFEDKQKKYLLGRRVTKDILDDNNNVIAKQGEEITEELVRKVFEAGKYIDLTINAE